MAVAGIDPDSYREGLSHAHVEALGRRPSALGDVPEHGGGVGILGVRLDGVDLVVRPREEGGVRGAEVEGGEEGAAVGARGGEEFVEEGEEAEGEDDGAAESEGFVGTAACVGGGIGGWEEVAGRNRHAVIIFGKFITLFGGA